MDIDLALIELGVIMLTLAVLGRLAVRIGLPTIPFFLLAGLVFGNGGAIPIEEAEPFIEVGSSLGVIFLLFLLGLEYTPQELRHSMRSNARAGGIDLVLNVLPGVVCGLVLGWGALGAVVLGGVTYISSSGIIAKLLTDLGRLGNRETPVVLSILVIEDLVMAVFLPVIAIALSGGSLIGGAISGGLSALLVVLVLRYSDRAGTGISVIVGRSSNELALIMLLGLATLVAGVAERLHISYAIGAFMLGIAISGPVAERARELLLPLRDSFAALFFVYFALNVAPSELLPVVPAAMALAVISAGTKYVTGIWAARIAGLGKRAAQRSAATLIPRGEFSIVLAGIGAASGLNEDLTSLVVVYVLLLAIGGSVAVRFTK